MNTYLAEQMAKAELRKHGLDGWTFGWTRAKTINGRCYGSQKRIELSGHFVVHNDQARVRNTLLHEIAHALVGVGHGHDNVWRRKAIEIGCDGQRCGESAAPRGSWQPVCLNHPGHVSPTRFHRAPLRVRFCAQCASVVKPENAMVWAKNGTVVPLGQMPVRYVRETLMLRRAYGSRFPL